ncbi:MAG: hypothetical protein ABIH11_04405 [Candidatus Altiarchaeota archaeon]
MDFTRALDYVEERVGSALRKSEKHFAATVLTLFLVSLCVRLWAAPSGIVLREDGFIYLLKAIEITRGNFSPLLSRSIGWPLFMSPMLGLLDVEDVFQGMRYARLISEFLGALTIIPLAYVGLRLFECRYTLMLLALFAFSPGLVESSGAATSESLFIILLLMMVYFMMKSLEDVRYALLSAVFGALSYYVRPNGIFSLFIVLSSILVLRGNINGLRIRHYVYIILVFSVVSAPFLLQRHSYFGSAFYYGENSKYFADSYEQVWCGNIQPPSLTEYVRTHSLSEYHRKFVFDGLARIIINIMYSTHPVITALFAYGIFRHGIEEKYIPMTAVFLAWIIGFTPTWDVFERMRHLWPLIPFMLVFATSSVRELLWGRRHAMTIILILLAVMTYHSFIEVAGNRDVMLSDDREDGLDWGGWVAGNVRGNAVVVEGEDLVMMNLPDTIVGGVDDTIHTYISPSGLNTSQPGCFEDFNSSMEWFNENGVTHIIVEESHMYKRPYLREVLYGSGKPYLTEVYSNYDTGKRWRVKAYLINWTLYDGVYDGG